MGQQYVGPRELVSRGVSPRAVPVSRRYLIRRVLIASSEYFGITVVLYTVLALAPGSPFNELAANVRSAGGGRSAAHQAEAQ